MVKDATTASSDSEEEVSASFDPQGPGHVSSNSEDEVSASSDLKALAPPPRTRFFLKERHRALGPVELIRELYGPATKNLESVTR